MAPRTARGFGRQATTRNLHSPGASLHRSDRGARQGDPRLRDAGACGWTRCRSTARSRAPSWRRSPARRSPPTAWAARRRCSCSATCSRPACISVDHPRFLSFIPAAPTEASMLFDLVCGASSIYGGSWLEGSGAVYAENQALRFVADLVGLPAGAGRRLRLGRHAGQPVRARDRAPRRPQPPRSPTTTGAGRSSRRARRTPRSSTPPR